MFAYELRADPMHRIGYFEDRRAANVRDRTDGADVARYWALGAYILMLLGAVTGGVLCIVGVAIAYVARSDARGTYLEGHYDKIIGTFWLALCMLVAGIITFFAGPIGIFLAFGGLAILLTRCVIGLYRLIGQRPWPGRE